MAGMAWEPDYATVDELAAYLRVSHDSDDVQLAVAVSAASRAIDRHTGRQFGQVDAAEERFYPVTYRCDRGGRYVVVVDDLMTVSGLAVAYDADPLTGYVLEPRNAAAIGRPWTRLSVARSTGWTPGADSDEVAVTALWGWSAVPAAVKQACLLQASRLHARRDSPFGIAGTPEAGNELRLLAKVDPDVAVSLRPYVRPGRVA